MSWPGLGLADTIGRSLHILSTLYTAVYSTLVLSTLYTAVYTILYTVYSHEHFFCFISPSDLIYFLRKNINLFSLHCHIFRIQHKHTNYHKSYIATQFCKILVRKNYLFLLLTGFTWYSIEHNLNISNLVFLYYGG